MKKSATSYVEIARKLRDEIRAGAYRDANPFPSLTQIMQRFRVSRPSAVRSIEKLKLLGLVKTVKGSGTFVSGQVQTIGLAIPGTADSEFFSAIMDSIVERCMRSGKDLVAGDAFPKNHKRRAAAAERLVRHFVEKGVSGVIVQPVGFNPDADKVNGIIEGFLAQAGIPVVLIDYDIAPPPGRSRYDLVGVDNFAAGRRLAAHLAASGAKRICCLRRILSADSVWTRFAGVEFETKRRPDADFSYIEAEPDDSMAIASGLERFRPDAIVASNDQAAVVLAKTLARLRVKVGRDVMLAGFDDVRAAARMKPGLTTVHQPCEAIAAVAFKTLLERIANPSMPPREILLDAPLVVRESTTLASRRFPVRPGGGEPVRAPALRRESSR